MRLLRYFIIGLVLVVSIQVAAIRLGPSSSILPGIPNAHASSVTITLTGCSVVSGVCTSAGWNGTTLNPNPTITVTQGDSVTFRLSSADHFTHQFLLDADNDDDQILPADCPAVDPCTAQFSTTATLTITASMAPGTYTYLCVIHNYNMFGAFTVNPSQSVGGVTVPGPSLSLLTPFAILAALCLGTIAIARGHTKRKM